MGTTVGNLYIAHGFSRGSLVCVVRRGRMILRWDGGMWSRGGTGIDLIFRYYWFDLIFGFELSLASFPCVLLVCTDSHWLKAIIMSPLRGFFRIWASSVRTPDGRWVDDFEMGRRDVVPRGDGNWRELRGR